MRSDHQKGAGGQLIRNSGTQEKSWENKSVKMVTRRGVESD
jgi:hypothetical protein